MNIVERIDREQCIARARMDEVGTTRVAAHGAGGERSGSQRAEEILPARAWPRPQCSGLSLGAARARQPAMHARSLLLLVPALCVGCGLLPVTAPNNQTEWTTSGGPDDSGAAQLSASGGDDGDGTPAAAHAPGPHVVSLPDGTTTLGIPLGTDDGRGPMLVEPVGGGPPELGTPLD